MLNANQMGQEPQAPKLPVKLTPLPGEGGPKPLGKELPLKAPTSKLNVWKQARETKLASANAKETLFKGKGAVRGESRASKRARLQRQSEIPTDKRTSTPASIAAQYPLTDIKSGSSTEARATRRWSAPPTTDTSHMDEELRAQTGLEAPRKVSMRQAAYEAAGKEPAEAEKAVAESSSRRTTSPFSKKQIDGALRSLAKSHWEKTAPKVDISGYTAASNTHKKTTALWNKSNPMPEPGTPEHGQWKEKSAAFKKTNPAPSTEPLEKARFFSDTLFKDSDAHKTPRSYLKQAMGLKRASDADVHAIKHLHGLNAIEDASNRASASRASADATQQKQTNMDQSSAFTLRGMPEISPERSAQVSTFVKNPLSMHFGTGSVEGKS